MALPAIDEPRTDGPEAVASRPPTAPSEVVVAASAGDDWVSCPSCGMDVRAEALERHRSTQH